MTFLLSTSYQITGTSFCFMHLYFIPFLRRTRGSYLADYPIKALGCEYNLPKAFEASAFPVHLLGSEGGYGEAYEDPQFFPKP